MIENSNIVACDQDGELLAGWETSTNATQANDESPRPPTVTKEESLLHSGPNSNITKKNENDKRIRRWGLRKIPKDSSSSSEYSDDYNSDSKEVLNDNASISSSENSDSTDGIGIQGKGDNDIPDEDSLGGERKSLVKAREGVSATSEMPQAKIGSYWNKFNKGSSREETDIKSSLLENGEKEDGYEDDTQHLKKSVSPLEKEMNESSSSRRPPLEEEDQIVLTNKIEAFGSGDVDNDSNGNNTGNKISELFNTFQKKRLRARGDIAEKRLTKEEIAILKQDVETDSTSMKAMDIATDTSNVKSRVMNWKNKVRAITAAAFAPDEALDRLGDPEDGDNGLGFYQNLSILDDNDESQSIDEIGGKSMRQMRARIEGEKVSFWEEVSDIINEDPNNLDQISDEEPGGNYNSIKMNASDDNTNYLRLDDESKRLVEQVRHLEACLRESNEEKEMWKSKALQFRKQIDELCSSKSLLDDIS